MPLIKNKTKQVICLTGPSGGSAAGGQVFPIKPAQTRTVPDDVWANATRHKSVKALVESGGLLKIHVPSERPAPAKAEASEAVDEDKPFAEMHWRQAKKYIEGSSDADHLKGLLEGEERKKVKEMLEERIEKLGAE